MFRSEGAINQYISGVILYDETIRQTAKDGTPLVKLIEAAGAAPGIKVDLGAKPLANFSGETITEGLDGLRERFDGYRRLGARFAKWRAVIHIDSFNGIPSAFAVEANAQMLARYAAVCQNAGLVPIVEPEVLMDGDHDIDRCGEVTEFVLKTVFMRLYEARVFLEGMVLKPNMGVPGEKIRSRLLQNQSRGPQFECLKTVSPPRFLASRSSPADNRMSRRPLILTPSRISADRGR